MIKHLPPVACASGDANEMRRRTFEEKLKEARRREQEKQRPSKEKLDEASCREQGNQTEMLHQTLSNMNMVEEEIKRRTPSQQKGSIYDSLL